MMHEPATGLLALFFIWIVTVMSPGPNFFAVVSEATGKSFRHGMMCALGVAVGDLVWAAGSLLGLGFLFAASAWLYRGVQLAGGVYLAWLGISMILSAVKKGSRSGEMVIPAGRRSFFRGLVVALSNPKAAAFFTSLLAVALPVDTGFMLSLAVIAVIAGVALAWYAFVAFVIRLAGVRLVFERSRRGIEGVVGVVFASAGLALIAGKR